VEAVNDPNLSHDPQAAKFLIVLGDQLPHDPDQQATFSSCTNSPPVDAGRDGTVGTGTTCSPRQRSRGSRPTGPRC
jgi:hypothetical protein